MIVYVNRSWEWGDYIYWKEPHGDEACLHVCSDRDTVLYRIHVRVFSGPLRVCEEVPIVISACDGRCMEHESNPISANGPLVAFATQPQKILRAFEESGGAPCTLYICSPEKASGETV